MSTISESTESDIEENIDRKNILADPWLGFATSPRNVASLATSQIWPTEVSDLAPRGSGNQNCGFHVVCVAAVTRFVV